jgi:two-component system sensor histidine kinase/response regulator
VTRVAGNPLSTADGGGVVTGGASENLQGIVNDVLTFSELDAGDLELDPSNFELRNALEEDCTMLVEQAHAKGLELRHYVDADVPLTVNGDRARLGQILLLLLSNAVKFTTFGEIVLHAWAEDREMLHFDVSDTGVGIHNDQAAQLFDAFLQADQSPTRQYGGTGLGLAIARKLAERMSGNIGAEPRKTGGSKFWFTAKMPTATRTETCGR